MSEKQKKIPIQKGKTVTSTTDASWPFMKANGWKKVTGEAKEQKTEASTAAQPPQK